MNDTTTSPSIVAPQGEQPAQRASSLLYGIDQIAQYTNMTEGQLKPLREAGIIPVFTFPGFDKPCAMTWEIDQRVEECWRHYRDKHPLPELEEVFAKQKERKRKARERNLGGARRE